MKRFIQKIVLMSLIIGFLLSGFIVFTQVTPAVYEGNYVGVIQDKIERLQSITTPKLVLVGGSNLAFGVDSAAIVNTLHMPVVNLGVQAGLGIGFITNMAKTSIHPGDIFVLSFEYELYDVDFAPNYALMWIAVENHAHLYKLFLNENPIPVILGYLSYGAKKILKLDSPDVYIPGEKATEVYSRNVFNLYGDVIYDKPDNIMHFPELAQMPPLDFSAINIDPVKIEIINAFISYAEERGARVFISFPSLMDRYILDISLAGAFEHSLRETIRAEFISSIQDYIMPEEYFFNTKYHLNSKGVEVRTERLIDNLLYSLHDTAE